MANRHAHKKLRAKIRARMIETGESYQAARHRLLAPPKQRGASEVDLLAITRFGVPMTLATFCGDTLDWCVVLGSAPRSAGPLPDGWSVLAMRMLRPRGIN